MERELYVLYGKSKLSFTLPEENLLQVLSPAAMPAVDEAETVREALRNPIGSPGLRELTRDVRRVLIITDDNTRPMPSGLTIPLMIAEFDRPEAEYDITLLIATGLHRPMTEPEIEERLGGLARKHRTVNHKAEDGGNLRFFGKLPSGNSLYLNALIAENELVISEGFIEPHFFAGFSGGRKSILPGVAGASTIMRNHSPRNIANPHARAANLPDNPIHLECEEAARMAGLKFILNVALDGGKRIAAAFAGDPFAAHAAGCAFVLDRMTAPCDRADIVITSNNGYPLDRNLYQAVKGMAAAADAVKRGGVIIIAAECADGVGHRGFADQMTQAGSAAELAGLLASGEPAHDKWQAQILARILAEHTVILVSSLVDAEAVRGMFIEPAATMGEAMHMAFGKMGPRAKVNVLPEGPVVTPLAKY